MNLLKNLMILAVLAAVGYGVYLSLSPNNTDSRSSVDAPTVELSGAKPSLTPGGPLALGGSSAGNSGVSSLGPASLSPPPLAGGPRNDPFGGTTSTPAAPYPATGSSAVTPITPPPPLPSNNPTATLGAPRPPEAAPDTTLPTGTGSASGVPALPPGNQSSASSAVRNLGPPPEIAANGGGAPAADKATNDLLQRQFAELMEGVRKYLDEGKLTEAQLALSILYANPRLPAEQAKQITELLDQLAGTVIYSRRSYLEPPYAVQPGDTIERIAQKYKLPWQLLARINGLMPPGAPNSDETVKDQPLPVGKELKVVQGPFDAIVSLERRQLTLMVQNRYAGRFPIGIGRDQPKLDGQYTVGQKQLNPTYYGPDGITIAPNDPKNPLGGAWIGLTDRIGIHGTADPHSVGRDDNRGTICVGDRDLQDLYGILSVGSRVTILR
jgi:LysM repeat protein